MRSRLSGASSTSLAKQWPPTRLESYNRFRIDNDANASPILALFALLALFLFGIIGLVVSGIVLGGAVNQDGICFAQSLVLFSTLLALTYTALHVESARRNYPIDRRQPCQHPLHSWAVIVARMAMVLWSCSAVAVGVTLGRGSGYEIGRIRALHADLITSITCFLATLTIVLIIERAADPFRLPWLSNRVTHRLSTLIGTQDEKDAAYLDKSISQRAPRNERRHRSRAHQSATAPEVEVWSTTTAAFRRDARTKPRTDALVSTQTPRNSSSQRTRPTPAGPRDITPSRHRGSNSDQTEWPSPLSPTSDHLPPHPSPPSSSSDPLTLTSETPPPPPQRRPQPTYQSPGRHPIRTPADELDHLSTPHNQPQPLFHLPSQSRLHTNLWVQTTNLPNPNPEQQYRNDQRQYQYDHRLGQHCYTLHPQQQNQRQEEARQRHQSYPVAASQQQGVHQGVASLRYSRYSQLPHSPTRRSPLSTMQRAEDPGSPVQKPPAVGRDGLRPLLLGQGGGLGRASADRTPTRTRSYVRLRPEPLAPKGRVLSGDVNLSRMNRGSGVEGVDGLRSHPVGMGSMPGAFVE